MKPIIKVENISKRYRVAAAPSHDTLRDQLAHSARSALRLAGRARRSGRDAREDDAFWALKDVSFEVQPGEVVGIVGRNGAGKSTLLKVLSRITEPTAGRVELYGRVGSLLEVGTGFHPELTGRENVYLNGAILGMARAEIAAKFDEIVAFAEIDRFIDAPVKHYSSGMYMRLAFAVAAHLDPEILIVDEVLAVGDAQFQAKCIGKMDAVAKQGRTVLFVSHNMAAVQRLCSSAIFLEQGRITACGTPSQVSAIYAQQGSSAALCWQRSSEPDKSAYITRVYVSDKDGNEAGYVTTGGSLSISFEFAVKNKCRNLQLAIGLLDGNDDVIFGSGPQDAGLLAPEQPGLYCATISLPSDILLAKRYAIRAVLWDDKDPHSLESIDALRFEVQETASLSNNTSSGRAGLLAVRCAWKIIEMSPTVAAAREGCQGLT